MYTQTKNWKLNLFYDLYCIHDPVCNFTFVGRIDEVTHSFVLPYLEIQPGNFSDSGCRVDPSATPISVWRLFSPQFPIAQDVVNRVLSEYSESPAVTRLRSIKYHHDRPSYLESVISSGVVEHCGVSTVIEAIAIASSRGITLRFRPDTLERAINTHLLINSFFSNLEHQVDFVTKLKGGY